MRQMLRDSLRFRNGDSIALIDDKRMIILAAVMQEQPWPHNSCT
jgi:hypothetical protein